MIKTASIFFTLLLIALSNQSEGSDAFVRTVHQEGQGILRSVGSSCFLYTPAHVVTRSQGILIETRLRKKLQGELINTYPQDLALVRLKDSSACEESSWNNGGERVEAILDVISSGRLNYKHQQGRLEVFDIQITDKAVDTTFNIKFKNDKKFRKGMSGSIITVGDYPIGMLLSVEGNTGKVLRMDTMADLSMRVILKYATDKEKIELGNLTPQLKVDRPSLIALPKISLENNTKITSFSGGVAQGFTKEVKILARGNTAFRVVSKPQRDNVRYKLEFIDDAGNRLFKKSRLYSNKALDWGIGVTSAGEYTLRITGTKGAGKLHLIVNTIATPEELSSTSNVLGVDDSAIGYLSGGTFAEYKILARGNTAFRVVSKPQRDNVRYKLEFIDDAGNILFKKSRLYSVNTLDWGIGVTSPGEYTLRITGSNGAGKFHLIVNTIATPEELISTSNVLGVNDSAIGYLSDGTFAEYKILAKGNTALRVVSKPQRDNVRYKLEFIDDAGNTLFKKERNYSEKALDWEVGVISPAEYTLRITGTNGAGKYHISLKN